LLSTVTATIIAIIARLSVTNARLAIRLATLARTEGGTGATGTASSR
jgi:hypothetical protein